MNSTLIAANWKMNKTMEEVDSFFRDWRKRDVPAEVEVAFFPSSPFLAATARLLPGGQSLGAQNCHECEKGAYTGEVSCSQLKSVGCSYVLAGHSERRHLFGESDDRIAKKVRAASKAGLRPILCVGETLSQREAGETLAVVLDQLRGGLSLLPPSTRFDVAYEPVWAIGTGRVARPSDAEGVHAAIRKSLRSRGDGDGTRILYGGSVKAENARELFAAREVDGLLVGGASLSPASFQAICNAAAG